MLAGGCCCGEIRYEADGAPFEQALCHCTLCRGTTGAPAVAWFTVEADGFRFVKGAPARFRSSAEAERTFCPRCGAQLTFVRHDYEGQRVDVTTASLDDPEAASPVEQIYVRSRLSWMERLDALPGDLHRRPR